MQQEKIIMRVSGTALVVALALASISADAQQK
jgi:hypothetical protein